MSRRSYRHYSHRRCRLRRARLGVKGGATVAATRRLTVRRTSLPSPRHNRNRHRPLPQTQTVCSTHASHPTYRRIRPNDRGRRGGPGAVRGVEGGPRARLSLGTTLALQPCGSGLSTHSASRPLLSTKVGCNGPLPERVSPRVFVCGDTDVPRGRARRRYLRGCRRQPSGRDRRRATRRSPAARAGATFTGNFRLPNKGASTSYITIRSGAADTRLPLDGVRILPTDAANLPMIKSPNTLPAMTAAAGAHHWRLQLLEFQANDRGYGDIITLGAGDTTQTLLVAGTARSRARPAVYPRRPGVGQKRGVSLHSGATWVLNCYIADMKGVGMDTQAISDTTARVRTRSPTTISRPRARTSCSAAPSPKIPNLIPSDIEFAGNHLYKPPAWRLPILAAPAGVSAAAGGSGALPPAPTPTASSQRAGRRRTRGRTRTALRRSPRRWVLAAASRCRGRRCANATTYRVYRGSAPGAQDRYFETTAAAFVDTGRQPASRTPAPG